MLFSAKEYNGCSVVDRRREIWHELCMVFCVYSFLRQQLFYSREATSQVGMFACTFGDSRQRGIIYIVIYGL